MTSKNDTKDWKHSWNLLSRVKKKNKIDSHFCSTYFYGGRGLGRKQEWEHKGSTSYKVQCAPNHSPYSPEIYKMLHNTCGQFPLSMAAGSYPHFPNCSTATDLLFPGK